MNENEANKYAAGFFVGVLENLHIAVCKEAIARKVDLSLEQVELVKQIANNAIAHARAEVSSK
jgi:hypothetical protein